jgi:hypothetical protein
VTDPPAEASAEVDDGEGSAGPGEPKTATVERREACVPRHGTQGASLGAWRAALCARPRVFRRAPERLSALRPPLKGVSEAKRQSPDAAMRARERDGLFDIVSWFSRDVLILRSAHAERVPQTRTRVRASRRMRTNHCVRPCFETHRSAPSVRMHLRRAARLLSMRARRAAHFGQTNPGVILAKRSQARVCVSGRSEGQPPAVRNDRRLRSIVSALLFTMGFATRTCRSMTQT